VNISQLKLRSEKFYDDDDDDDDDDNNNNNLNSYVILLFLLSKVMSPYPLFLWPDFPYFAVGPTAKWLCSNA
jgi:hypothetical protein